MTLHKNLYALSMIFVLAGCGGDDDATTTNNRAPTAALGISPSSTPANDNFQTVVTLNGSASSDPDGDTLTFLWTTEMAIFVDGTSASSPIAKATFPGLHDYPVTLKVTDSGGLSDAATGNVAVQ